MDNTSLNFCMRFINKSRYFLEDRSKEIQCRTQIRVNSVSIMQMLFPDSKSKPKIYVIAAIKALHKNVNEISVLY